MNSVFNSYLDKIEQSIKYFLPDEFSAEWADLSFGIQPECLNKNHFTPLLKPTSELISLGGKRWRPLLLVLTAEAAGGENPAITDSAYKLCPLVEYVHNASLIHDDIEDSSDTRRGKPAAYISYGTDVAINAGTWLFFQASVSINNTDIPEQVKLKLYQLYTQKMRCIHLGQAMDISWHKDKHILPSEQEYFAMVQNKTGILSSLAVSIGTTLARLDPEKSKALDTAASLLGTGFQIIDDVINLTTGNPGKKRGDDIVEGKKSLPVLKFAKNADKASLEELFSCFERAAVDGIESPAVEKAISIISDSNAIKQAADQGISIINENLKTFSDILGKNRQTELIELLFTDMIPQNLKSGELY